MPFFDNTGVDDSTLHHPIWGAFALVKDRLEQLLVLNLGWSLHLFPALIAFAFPALPLWLRVPLFLYTGILLSLATGPLFALAARICEDEALRLDLLKEAIRDHALPGIRHLTPLYGLLGLLLWALILALALHILLLITLLQLLFLLVLLCSIYWGPLFVAHPEASSLRLLRRSIRLVWLRPFAALQTWFVMLLCLIIGIISVGGVFLIVPVLVAVLQTLRYQRSSVRKRKVQPQPA